MSESVNPQEATDRFDQLTDLLTAARIPPNIATATACWQVAFNLFSASGVTAEAMKEWVDGWFKLRRENELIRSGINEKTNDFVNEILNKVSKEKES